MPGFLHALKTAAVREVTIGGGEWRLRRVSSADLARASVTSLAIMPVDVLARSAKKMAKGEEIDAEAMTAEAIRKMSPEQAGKAANLSDGMICAGVTHVRAVGEIEWEPVRFVMNRDKANDDGTMWVGDLPQDIRSALSAAVRAHTTEDGEAVERLQSFRGTA